MNHQWKLNRKLFPHRHLHPVALHTTVLIVVVLSCVAFFHVFFCYGFFSHVETELMTSTMESLKCLAQGHIHSRSRY